MYCLLFYIVFGSFPEFIMGSGLPDVEKADHVQKLFAVQLVMFTKCEISSNLFPKMHIPVSKMAISLIDQSSNF